MGRERKGCIYEEMTNSGMYSPIFRRGVGLVPRKHRWVGEISVHGKRYRFRSTNYNNVAFWLGNMVARFKDE